MSIHIRHAEPGDYEALYQLYSQPQVIHGTMGIPYPSLESWEKRLTDTANDLCNLVALLDNAVVGQAVLWSKSTSPRRRHAATLGIAVHDQYHGKGVGKALMHALLDLADNWLNLARIELNVFSDNQHAIALYQKYGFEIEGTHRAFAFRAGQYADGLSMARLSPALKQSK